MSGVCNLVGKKNLVVACWLKSIASSAKISKFWSNIWVSFCKMGKKIFGQLFFKKVTPTPPRYQNFLDPKIFETFGPVVGRGRAVPQIESHL